MILSLRSNLHLDDFRHTFLLLAVSTCVIIEQVCNQVGGGGVDGGGGGGGAGVMGGGGGGFGGPPSPSFLRTPFPIPELHIVCILYHLY